ncbi:hypothetical protein GCWU000341_00766 [Oribacterium sp. oral taxon 078 str. F0262]|nr:hypothetical protein GCWU000341_00766 [Oribacterium sp. oral taxon 078 str. F0262]
MGEALRALCFHDIIAELVQGLYDSGVKALLWSCDRTEEAAGLYAAPRSMIQGALLKVVRE